MLSSVATLSTLSALSISPGVRSAAPVALQSSATVAAAAAFPLLAGMALVTWVFLDARARDSDHPVFWALAVLFVPTLLLYVHYRGERTRPQSDAERAALTFLLAVLAAMLAAAVFSPPDVFVQPRDAFGALLVTLPLFYLLVYRTEDDGDGEDGED